MRWWRRLEKIGWNNCVRNEEILHRVRKEKHFLHTRGKKDSKDWSHA